MRIRFRSLRKRIQIKLSKLYIRLIIFLFWLGIIWLWLRRILINLLSILLFRRFWRIYIILLFNFWLFFTYILSRIFDSTSLLLILNIILIINIVLSLNLIRFYIILLAGLSRICIFYIFIFVLIINCLFSCTYLIYGWVTPIIIYITVNLFISFRCFTTILIWRKHKIFKIYDGIRLTCQK